MEMRGMENKLQKKQKIQSDFFSTERSQMLGEIYMTAAYIFAGSQNSVKECFEQFGKHCPCSEKKVGQDDPLYLN